MDSALVVGSTGLVGSYILSTLIAHPTSTSILPLARRAPSSSSPKLSPLLSADTSTWASLIASLPTPPPIVFSALGTTRAAAGSFAAQRLIDYDLNVAVARAAKDRGVRVYVLISSNGADASSRLGYQAMKGELEDAVRAMDFERTVIVWPGLIVGGRNETRVAEAVAQGAARLFRNLAPGWVDSWAQDAEVIARAAVVAGEAALKGEGEKVRVLGMADVVRLGKTEWKA